MGEGDERRSKHRSDSWVACSDLIAASNQENHHRSLEKKCLECENQSFDGYVESTDGDDWDQHLGVVLTDRSQRITHVSQGFTGRLLCSHLKTTFRAEQRAWEWNRSSTHIKHSDTHKHSDTLYPAQFFSSPHRRTYWLQRAGDAW